MATKFLVVESPVHGKDVLLAITDGSANEKTGDMCQIFILNPTVAPLDAIKSGEDSLVCGNCPQRHFVGGACYVNVGQSPTSIYKSWVKQGRPTDDPEDFIDQAARRYVRAGAYGDPSHIPAWLVSELDSISRGMTCYSHDWRNPIVADVWKSRAMASLDSPAQIKHAEAMGWKWFLAADLDTLPPGSVRCDNEVDSRTQCRDCMRCNGKNESVVITPHGIRKNKFDLSKR